MIPLWGSAQWEQFYNWSGAWARCTLADGRSATAVESSDKQAKRAAFTRACQMVKP